MFTVVLDDDVALLNLPSLIISVTERLTGYIDFAGLELSIFFLLQPVVLDNWHSDFVLSTTCLFQGGS